MIDAKNTTICKNVNHLRLKLLDFGHATVNKEWCGKSLNPDFSRLYYIISGSSRVTSLDGKCVLMEKGKWYLLPAGSSFDYECEDEMEHIYIHLKLCDLDEMDLLDNLTSTCSIDFPEDKSDFFLQCIHSNDISDGLLIRHEVYHVILSIITKYNVKFEIKKFSPCVVKAIKYIKENLSMQLTISEIAKNIFVSNGTLTTHFRNEISKSVNEYINDIIMFEASQLLLKSNASILEISEKFGFSDQFYFSRRFKSKFGVSPRKYRKTIIM